MRALDILEPAHSPDLPAALFLLGSMRYEQKNFQQAELLYRRALEMERARAVDPSANPLVASLMSALALARMRLGKREEALKLSSEAVAVAAKAYPNHASAGAILWNHALILRSLHPKMRRVARRVRGRSFREFRRMRQDTLWIVEHYHDKSSGAGPVFWPDGITVADECSKAAFRAAPGAKPKFKK